MKRLISAGVTTLLILLSAPSQSASALASDSRGHTTSASECNNYSGNTKIVCMAISQTYDSSTIASFLRVYAGPLAEKDPIVSRQLASAFNALGNPSLAMEPRFPRILCIEKMTELVIVPAIKQQPAAFQSGSLLKSWRALDAVLNADEGSTSLSEMGWRGSSLRSYFAEKISGLSGEPKQLGEWAAKRAQQLGNPNARRVISRQMTQLIDFCPGRYDSSPLTIIANGYVDLKGDRVGPDTPGYSDNYKRCNKMQPQPEFTLWFRYSSGRLEYERYRYDGPGSGEIANTKTGIPLPYVIYFDASGVVYGDVDEDTASVKLEPNPWVMCGLVPARQ